jgi:hypothetical protein
MQPAGAGWRLVVRRGLLLALVVSALAGAVPAYAGLPDGVERGITVPVADPPGAAMGTDPQARPTR